jgi:hypothetical protein
MASRRESTCVACYRLSFDNHEIFEVEIDGKRPARDYAAEMCVGTIYRVTRGARETEPLRRETGGALEIYAVSAETALLIAKQVLREITKAEVASVGQCGGPSALPLLDPI